MEKQFNHPKIAKPLKRKIAKLFLDKEKHYNETYHTMTENFQNQKKFTDEMNLRFRTAKPLKKDTFVLLTNQQQVDGVSKKILPFKTGPYLITDKPTEATYILKNNNKEHITIHRNHIVPYYPKEKHIKLELQNYLPTDEILTLKQPNITGKRNADIQQTENTDNTHKKNLRNRKIKLF